MFLLQANTTSLINVADLQLIAPELILTACACVALVMEVILPYRKSKLTAYFSLVGVALAFVSLALQWWYMGSSLPFDGFYGMVRIDGFALLFKAIFLIAAALAIGISTRFLDIEGEQHGEYYALVLFATVGMMFIACGYDLISLYISLELMALTFYVLVAFTKREKKSNEAAMKYFLLGAFSSGVLLYGMSLLYGIAGSTNIGEIGSRLSRLVPQIQSAASSAGRREPDDSQVCRPLLLLGMIALGAGLFFKVAAVPFHMWAPDVYEGAPTSVTAFLSTGSKAASFALYARIFSEALGGMRADWAPLLGLVAAITIMVGNWAAVTQENSKRLLAYSSISNAGYLLLALVANNLYGYIGLIIYLFVYTLMNMGAFGVIISLRRRGIIGDNVDDLTGLGQKAPVHGRDDGDLHAVTRRPADHRRFYRQVLSVWRLDSARRRRRKELVLLAGGLGHPQYRRLVLLLLPLHQGDVSRRSHRRQQAAGAFTGVANGAGRFGDRHHRDRHLSAAFIKLAQD